MASYTGQALIEQMNSLQVPYGALAVWGLGQMGVALKAGDQIIYIDPCLSDVVVEKFPALAKTSARAFPPPLEPHQITNAAVLLCSHEHLDHADPLTLGPLALASPNAQFVLSGWSHAPFDEAGIDRQRRTVLPALTPTALGAATVTVIPAAHIQLEHDEARGHRWLGFLIEWNGVTFYHSGDTIVYDGYLTTMRGLPAVDLAYVAINGRDARRDAAGLVGNLNPTEAVWLARELGWDTLIGGHNDLFLFNTLRAGDLADAVRQQHPRLKHHTLQPGELYLYLR